MIAPFSFLNHTSDDSYAPKFITVGADSAAWSDDLGLTWNASSINAGNWTHVVGDKNGTYIAVRQVIGSPNYIEVAVSRDGGLNFDEYHTVVSGVLESPYSLIHDGEKWIMSTAVFFGANFGRLFTSDDGITWTQQNTPDDFNFWSISYGDGVYVLACEGPPNFYQSTDLITWTSQSLNTNLYDNIAYLRGLTSVGGFVAHSSNSPTFASRSAALVSPWTASGSVAVYATSGLSTRYFTVPGNNANWLYAGTTSVPRPQNSNWVGISSNADYVSSVEDLVFVACSRNGTRRIARQTHADGEDPFTLIDSATVNSMPLGAIYYG